MKNIIYCLILSAYTFLISCSGETPKGEIILSSGEKATVKVVNLPEDFQMDTEAMVYRSEDWHDGIVSYYSGNSFPKKNSNGKIISYYKAKIIKH